MTNKLAIEVREIKDSKPGLMPPKSHKKDIQIRALCEADINVLVDSFARHQWDKPRKTFENYLCEQQSGQRHCWVAFLKDELAGYVTLNWRSCYEPLFANNLPEIMDLNVLPQRNRPSLA